MDSINVLVPELWGDLMSTILTGFLTKIWTENETAVLAQHVQTPTNIIICWLSFFRSSRRPAGFR